MRGWLRFNRRVGTARAFQRLKRLRGGSPVGKGGRGTLPLNHCLVDRYAAGRKQHRQKFGRSKKVGLTSFGNLTFNQPV